MTLLLMASCGCDQGRLFTDAAGQCALRPPTWTAQRLASTGIVEAKVLFVDFSDAPASATPAQVFAQLVPAGSAFFTAMSYGRLDFRLIPDLRWTRMSKPSSAYNFGTFTAHRAYLKEAIERSGAGVDYRGMQALYVIAPADVSALHRGPAFVGRRMLFGLINTGLTANGTTIYNGATSGGDLSQWGYKWFNHETVHTMGLPDLYAYEGDTHRFVGPYSLMGDIAGNAVEMFAYERWMLGWLDSAQIYCQPDGERMTRLSPIETIGGRKAVLVPTGRNTALLVESRRALGYDAGLLREGVLVYSINTTIAGGRGPIQVIGMPGNTGAAATLAKGQSLTVGTVTVSVVDASAGGDTVNITVKRKSAAESWW